MDLVDIARVTLDWIPDRDNATIMLATFGPESNYDAAAVGDPVEPALTQWREHACEGFLSFGLGQVFLGVHHDMIQQMSGHADPCAQAEWLKTPDNNLRACAAILKNQGFNAWTGFKTGAYSSYLPAAQEAIREALGSPSAPPAPPSAPTPSQLAFPLTIEARDADGRAVHVFLHVTP